MQLCGRELFFLQGQEWIISDSRKIFLGSEKRKRAGAAVITSVE